MTAKILAIDTTTEYCSAALALNGQIYARKIHAPREHAQRILGLIDSLLLATECTLKDMDALAFGCGPGSFTGLRIATGVIQGLALGADLPVLPISSLRSMALMAATETGEKRVMAALDARQHEVYWGLYTACDDELMRLEGKECVSTPLAVPLPKRLGDWIGAGPGWQAYQGELAERTQGKQKAIYEDFHPQAQAVVELALRDYALGKAKPAHEAMPAYVRDQVVSLPGA